MIDKNIAISAQGFEIFPYTQAEKSLYASIITCPLTMALLQEAEIPSKVDGVFNYLLKLNEKQPLPLLYLAVKELGEDFANMTVMVKDEVKGEVNIGIQVVTEKRGQGKAHIPWQLLIDELFTRYPIETISAETIDENIACKKLLLKTGFKSLGALDKKDVEVLVKNGLVKGNWQAFKLFRADWVKTNQLKEN